jgi:hypothetical protein
MYLEVCPQHGHSYSSQIHNAVSSANPADVVCAHNVPLPSLNPTADKYSMYFDCERPCLARHRCSVQSNAVNTSVSHELI